MQNITSILSSQPSLFILGVLIILFLVALSACMPFIINYLMKLSEKIKSEKVSMRVKDAIKKVGVIVSTLVDAENVVFRKEYVEAIKDGKIDDSEVAAMVAKVSAKAMEILKPELATLKSYLVGDMVLEYITAAVKSYLVALVNAKISDSKSLTSSPSETK